MMSGIAEYGKGDYFFIAGSESIPKVLQIANKGFMGLLGTHSTLTVKFFPKFLS